MKLKKLFALALCFAVVGSCLAFAAPAHAADVDGLVTSKVVTDNGDNTATIRLESYVTGSIQVDTEDINVPADIVLVLDTTTSMAFDLAVTTTKELAVLDTHYGATEGIYMMQAGYYQLSMRYSNNQWEYNYSNNWRPVADVAEEYQIVTSRLNALKMAVIAFIDNVEENAGDDVDHRIAITTFNARDSGNTVYQLSSVKTDGDKLKNAIRNLQTAGIETVPSEGLDEALTIINSIDATRVSSKIAIMFTDGSPGFLGGIATELYANYAIASSRNLKVAGASVYALGVFDSDDADNSTVSNYMNYVSSNYPNATAMNRPGEKKSSTYYMTASDATSLDGIFTTISNNIQSGSATIPLDTTTVVQDTVSEYFDLPENTTDVKVYTAEARYSNTGVLSWGADTPFAANVSFVDTNDDNVDDSVQVTNFDFGGNFVTETGYTAGNAAQAGNFHGKKLIVEFTVSAKDGFLGGVNVPTNVTATSGIIHGDELLENFPEPTTKVDVSAPANLRVTGTAKNIYLGSTLDNAALAALTEGAKLYIVLPGDNQIEVKDAWQTAFVDLSYSAAVGDTTTVTAYDLTCTVNIAGTDDVLTTATTQSAGALNVYKPVLSTSDCTVFLCGDEPSFTTAVTWKNGDAEANPATMIGTAPAVLPSYSQSTAFTDCTPVTVTVNTINGKNVVKNTHYIANDFKVHVVKPVIENGSAAIKLGSSVPFTDQIAWASKCACNTYEKPLTGSRDLTVNYYSGTSLIAGEEYPDTCTVYTKKAVIGGAEYKDANNNGITGTFTAHVHAPSIVGKNSVIYMGNGTTLDKGDVTLTWNRACMKNDGSVLETGKDPAGVAEPDYQFSESKDAFTSCANYNVTLTKIGQKSVSGYTSSLTVHVLKPDVSIKPSEQVIYYGDEAVFIPSISWSCTNNQHTDLSATEGVPTATEKDCKLNYQDMHFTGCKDDVTASVTIETVKGNKVYSSNTSTVHVLKPEITAANKTLYWTQPYGLNSSMTTAAKWKCKHTDNEKVDLGAAPEPDFTFVNKGVVETNETDLVLDDCTTYVVTATINGLEFPLDDNSNSVTIHVVKPVISCADTAIYLGNSVDLNAQMTEDPAWKCTTSTCPRHVTLAVKDNKDNRVAPALDHEFSTVENEAAYEPSTCTPVRVTSTIKTGSVSKDVTPTQNTFTVHVYVPQFTVTTQDLWADCGANVDLNLALKNEHAWIWVDRKGDDCTLPAAEPKEVSVIKVQFEPASSVNPLGEYDVDVNVNSLTCKVNGVDYIAVEKQSGKTGDEQLVIVPFDDAGHDFTVHVNKFKAIITNNGTQNAIYTLSNGTKVAVEAGKSTTVAGLICGKEYAISETADNDWTWRYATEATKNTAAYTVGSVDNKPETDSSVNVDMNYGEKTNTKWLADEDCVVNKATTQATTINPTLSVKKKDEEVTNA